MAKKKPEAGTPDEGAGKKTTVKLWADVARKARIVAAIRGQDLFDYLDAVLRPVVFRDHEQAIRAEGREGGEA